MTYLQACSVIKLCLLSDCNESLIYVQRKLEVWLHEDCDSMGFFVDPHSVSWIKKDKICLGVEEFGLLEK